ncbi:hypothetical protein ASPWEDRAFT_242537 [Aspergillus wentii DTO 134E9]|uniref:Uncharacterized protein n=1 Tax=Aspergillus wentii DTO 134E9 TaxID=1073089 RepID=A0A1L9S1N1_ASPWE|nr:uncharacterized protein ASPWEDRAFT_242537 [Aspergillus wentii DTO 134E9]OJJ41055.1 hypothetical protein ASPWEDRAFT_242537 [Aspergillus wentii DTO 134E9]
MPTKNLKVCLLQHRPDLANIFCRRNPLLRFSHNGNFPKPRLWLLADVHRHSYLSVMLKETRYLIDRQYEVLLFHYNYNYIVPYLGPKPHSDERLKRKFNLCLDYRPNIAGNKTRPLFRFVLRSQQGKYTQEVKDGMRWAHQYCPALSLPATFRPLRVTLFLESSTRRIIPYLCRSLNRQFVGWI